MNIDEFELKIANEMEDINDDQTGGAIDIRSFQFLEIVQEYRAMFGDDTKSNFKAMFGFRCKAKTTEIANKILSKFYAGVFKS